jgi:hypothetical protein
MTWGRGGEIGVEQVSWTLSHMVVRISCRALGSIPQKEGVFAGCNFHSLLPFLEFRQTPDNSTDSTRLKTRALFLTSVHRQWSSPEDITYFPEDITYFCIYNLHDLSFMFLQGGAHEVTCLVFKGCRRVFGKLCGLNNWYSGGFKLSMLSTVC